MHFEKPWLSLKNLGCLKFLSMQDANHFFPATLVSKRQKDSTCGAKVNHTHQQQHCPLASSLLD